MRPGRPFPRIRPPSFSEITIALHVLTKKGWSHEQVAEDHAQRRASIEEIEQDLLMQRRSVTCRVQCDITTPNRDVHEEDDDVEQAERYPEPCPRLEEELVEATDQGLG